MRLATTPFVLTAALAAAAAQATEHPSSYELQQTIHSLAIASPYRMSESARAGTIRYRIALQDGISWNWPETGEQHVEMQADGIVLTICATCGNEPAPSPEQLQAYRQSNRWVQGDDARIKAFARAAGGGRLVDPRMRRLVLAVQKHMTGAIDYRDYHTAREALDARSGDCTEFAVLLAAAARAVGIPARVVGGMAYSSRFVGRSHTFGPHMWVQAWNGSRWVSYDAGLGRFDSGHIALVTGDGTPDSMRGVLYAMAKMRIVDAAGIVSDTGSLSEDR